VNDTKGANPVAAMRARLEALPPGAPLPYPEARRGDVVDDYHGTKVADPYRWLEDPDSPETRAWVQAENALTFAWLGQIPARDRIRARLTALWDYERMGVPVWRNGRLFFEKNDGLQNQDVLYVQDGAGAPRVLLDPNTLSTDGTVALSSYEVSRDGKRLAYGLARAGSDWIELHVRDVDSGRDLPDEISWVKFSDPHWDATGEGFYYAGYDPPKDPSKSLRTPNYYQKLYYHRVGTPQSDDVLIYERKDHKDWGFDARVTDDGALLVIEVWVGTSPKNAVFYRDLRTPTDAAAEAPIVELFHDFDAAYHVVGHVDGPRGGTVFVLTDKDAPRSRLVAVDLAHPEPANWRELVPQTQDTLRAVHLVAGRFFLDYLHDAHSLVLVRRLDGTPDGAIPLPTLGTVWGFDGRAEDPVAYFAFSSFTFPTTIYRYDPRTRTRAEVFAPKVALDPDRFVVQQRFAKSKDGTRVPYFVAHRKGLALDGSNPTYLYGYGGFDISLTPRYATSIRVWMEMGGVYVMANLRGGGEYGQDWHLAGTKLHKQRVFDDFIAVAEDLIARGYTSTPHLAIGGGSNGGLLVGATLTQRPDLFAAACPAVGVMDMLRFHKFTIGWAWASDYGTSDDPEQFKALYAYSPLHNIHPGTAYPATFITTADHDDRVVPAHSFKFAATLQAAQKGPAPILIRIETRAGHGAGKPTQKVIEEIADKWSFLTRVLHMKLPDDFGAASPVPAPDDQPPHAG